MGHRGMGTELHVAAGPKPHEVAVAGVADGACRVHRGVEAHELVSPRDEVVAHVLVVAPVAGGEHDGLRVDLRVVAVGVMHVGSGDLAVLYDELLAPRGVDELGTHFLGFRRACVERPLHVRVRSDGAVEVRVVLGFVVVALKRGEALRADVVGLVGLLVGSGAREHLEISALDEPVEVLARMVVPIAEEVGGRAVAHVFHELVDDDVFASPFDAEILLDLRADDAEIACHRNGGKLSSLFDADDLRAFFGGGFCSCDAREAEADDEHVAVLRLFDVGRNGRCRHEVRGEVSRFARGGTALCGGVACGVRLARVGGIGCWSASYEACSAGGNRRGGTQSDKCTSA